MTDKTSPIIQFPANKQVVQNDQLQQLLDNYQRLSLAEKKYWTAMISVDGVGPSTFYLIANYLKKNRITWTNFWVNKTGLWLKMSLSNKIVESINNFKKEYEIDSYWELLRSKDISVIDITQSEYPYWLKQIYDPPPILFVKGDLGWVANLPIAIVGTRKMTAYGKMATQKIVRELVANEACIVSGFMYGVDVEAQKTAIDYTGTTVGVLGYGFDHIYPGSQHHLMIKMLKTGRAAFISEYPPFVRATKGTFPRRNRIISGLSLGVVVTEAGVKSGTQITVGYALDYGRDVFAVSGPITSPYHEGVKKMLNQGAVLVGSGMEILNNLSASNWSKNKMFDQENNQEIESSMSVSLLNLDPLQKEIVQSLFIMPSTARELADQLKIEQTVVINCLTDLEIRQIVEVCANQWVLKNGINNAI